jgi:uncharacterized protein
MGSLLEWFRSRREAKVIRTIKEHAKKSYNCVVQFKDALSLFFADDLKGAMSSIHKVSQIEHECDELRRQVLYELAKGELSPKVRNDLAHLIGRLDNVANAANAAARRLAILKPEFAQKISDLILEMIDKSILGAEVLRNTIDIEIEGATEEVDSSVLKINQLEHEVDQVHYKLLQELNQPAYNTIPPFVALNIYELIENIERISDSCENTADFVKIINLEAVSKDIKVMKESSEKPVDDS